MIDLASVHFCEACFEFGIVSVVNGRITVEYCNCEIERINV
jgi:hypothetical protein